MTPSSFTVFPELPFELRLKIWEHAMPGPRVLGVSPKMQYRSDHGGIIPVKMVWRTSAPNLNLLHVCHESREEALRVYRPSFGIPLEPGQNHVDFTNDTIYFGGLGRGFPDLDLLLQSTFGFPGNYLLDMFLGADTGVKDAEKIQRMILDIDEDRYGRRLLIWDEIRLFKGLQELTVLLWEDDLEADRLMSLYRSTLRQVASIHPEWVVPKITVISTYSQRVWGTMNSSTLTIE